MTNPEATEVQSAEKGPEAGEKEMFLAVKFQKLLVSPCPSTHSQQSTEAAKTISEQSLNSIRKTERRRRKSVIQRSKLGESLVKMQQKTSSVELSSRIEESCSTPQGGGKVFGRKFSASLENFAGLSLGEKEARVEDTVGENFKTASGCSGCKRKRATSPPVEALASPPLSSCGQQARLGTPSGWEDTTADDLAGYLEDTTFFPKRMSYMAEMMYT